ncbi:hypothetical protein HRI96_06015 [Treponema parvum]|uniref:Uncharacterized protein n=1 Tax=Treponema parvum TaxID=138851 RepID=A0A975EZH3_9SPIR|nr:hypothetical protein [Treponema parvum]QTQ11795.1 hypothetical protein HRI96_06015 [Treponema parvum]QTQ16237.1 hypothetical protein HXT04_05790 [Treponema parvum]
MKIKTFFIFMFFLAFSALSAEAFESSVPKEIELQEIELDKRKPSWTKVFGGKTVKMPVLFSDGAALLHDGNKICAVSEDGTELWQKKISGISQKTVFGATTNDFLYFSDKNNVLHIINRSGYTVLKIGLPFIPINTVIEGFDGCLFIFGEQYVGCYGLNGICKWYILTPKQSSCPAQMLQDGSILIFFEGDRNTKAFATRIGRFGEEKEKFVFDAKPLKSCSSEDGVYVLFSDRTVTLFSCPNEDDENVETKSRILPPLINIDILGSSLFFACDGRTEDSLVISDSNVLFSFAFSSNSVLKKVNFNMKDLKDERFVSDGSFLLYCTDSWETVFYRFSQTSKNKPIKIQKKYKIPSTKYEEYERLAAVETEKKLSGGYYGANEETYISELQGFIEAYLAFLRQKITNVRAEPPEYTKDIQYLAEVFSNLGLYGTDVFTQLTAELISMERSSPLLIILINAAGDIGFDGNRQLFFAIRKKIAEFSGQFENNDAMIAACCQSLYKLSLFMGKKYADESCSLISGLLHPRYGKNINRTAKEALIKISDLKP